MRGTFPLRIAGLSQLDEYVGMTCSEIDGKLELGVNLRGRSFSKPLMDRLMEHLGIHIDPNRFIVRVIRIDALGESVNPSPFKVTDYEDLMRESWEGSMLKNLLSHTFVFLAIDEGRPETAVFRGYVVHRFDGAMMDSAKRVWDDTRDKVIRGDYSHFLTDKDTGTFFFKIHASKTEVKVHTNNGGYQNPRSFWISRNLLSDILRGL